MIGYLVQDVPQTEKCVLIFKTIYSFDIWFMHTQTRMVIRHSNVQKSSKHNVNNTNPTHNQINNINVERTLNCFLFCSCVVKLTKSRRKKKQFKINGNLHLQHMEIANGTV